MKVPAPAGELNARISGDGDDVVVLLHPLALSGECWGALTPMLAEHARVVALDARGHGESDWDGQQFTVEDMSADVLAVLDALDVEQASLVGMSMGGCAALDLASRRPDRVRRLLLADTTSCYGPDRVSTWEERAEKAESVDREQQVRFQMDRWFSESFREAQPDEARRIADIFVATESKVHAAACRALGAFDGTAGMPAVTAATWVVVGEEDYATPPDMAAALSAGIDGARLDVLESTRHLSLVQRRDLWPALVEFTTTGG